MGNGASGSKYLEGSADGAIEARGPPNHASVPAVCSAPTPRHRRCSRVSNNGPNGAAPVSDRGEGGEVRKRVGEEEGGSVGGWKCGAELSLAGRVPIRKPKASNNVRRPWHRSIGRDRASPADRAMRRIVGEDIQNCRRVVWTLHILCHFNKAARAVNGGGACGGAACKCCARPRKHWVGHACARPDLHAPHGIPQTQRRRDAQTHRCADARTRSLATTPTKKGDTSASSASGIRTY